MGEFPGSGRRADLFQNSRRKQAALLKTADGLPDNSLECSWFYLEWAFHVAPFCVP